MEKPKRSKKQIHIDQKHLKSSHIGMLYSRIGVFRFLRLIVRVVKYLKRIIYKEL